ncbi:MAG: ATP-binding protein [Treponema sp.]
MIGRKEELTQLEKMYSSSKFEFLIMYGRRRIGKTTILQEFCKTHKSLFFSAQEKNDPLSLHDFSKLIQNYFDRGFIADFTNWEDAFDYVSRKAPEERFVLIIDEFPFIAEPNPAIKSILQHKIDLSWKDKNIFLILCGSSVSFMENEVMGCKSPLYGRSTGSIEIKPFDYLESSEFFPHYKNVDKLTSYGILGGVPRYLNAFDSKKPVRENIITKILENGTFLNDEPQFLLRMELREPVIYNSILQAVSNGCNKVSEISSRIHEDKSKCSKYLITLQTIRLLEKHVPAGEKTESKKGIYEITDNFYKFWYRYVFSNQNYYGMLGSEKAADEIMAEINDYMGPVFENICRQYLVRLAKAGMLPFIPFTIGKWWGNNPVIKAQDDIDILCIDKSGTKALFCECKFRNKKMPVSEYDDLVRAVQAFPRIKEKHLMFFSKSGFTDEVVRRAEKENTKLTGIDDLFNI